MKHALKTGIAKLFRIRPKVSSFEPTTDAPVNKNVEKYHLNVVKDQSTLKSSLSILRNLSLGLVLGCLIYYRKEIFKLPSGVGFSKNYILAEPVTVTFEDVRGMSECREELLDVLDILKNRKKYQEIGAKLPKGILLTGEPGTGKTLLARALAGEAGVSFFSCSGSSFDEIFTGVGAKRVRELFSAAREHKPSIIYIDEIDAMGLSRESSSSSRQNGVLNQFLVEMDGFDQYEDILVIASTNVPKDLDKALVRPGRFSKEINIPVPNLSDRKDIIKYYTDKVYFYDSVDKIAKITAGFTGADISNLINMAVLIAIKDGRNACTFEDIEKAKDRITMGVAFKNRVRSDKSLYKTALLEISKALTIILTPGSNYLYKTTILKRGTDDGKTTAMPLNDQVSFNKQQMLAAIDANLSKKVCEELFFDINKNTDRPAKDLKKASGLIMDFLLQGMFEESVGLIYHEDPRNIGPERKNQIDLQAELILRQSYNRVKKLLEPKMELIKYLANELVAKETMDLFEIRELIQKFNRQ
jgi:ATP-dependent metalloprotease